ncbi:MAG: alanine--tRNA ligase [Sedimentisphaerales bacterium]|nr:alanine--tRNA ligase [Sedimentisphaerales bacterium]
MLTSQEIRQGFIEFFKQKGHTFVASSSVVPLDDPTLLFTNAGMNQYKDIFLGSEKRDYSRAVNSQKCIRVSGKHNDLEEVGKDTYHHTFFEMLGNWSFGDYFKDEAIAWAWELFTKVWKFDPERLWASVFGGDPTDGVEADTESEALWLKNSSLPTERILRFGKKDNFWEMGEIGPCGPCSEIHYDLGPENCDKKGVKHECCVNGDCGRFIELWNLVFIQYNRDETGQLKELPSKHVDTGAGLERIVAVLQNQPSNYDTDLFKPLLDKIAELTGKTYSAQIGNQVDNAFRVIADHVRMLTFSITDGSLPSNDGRGYVLRRILRRATRFGQLLDMHEPFIYKLVPTLVEQMGEVYPELPGRAQHVGNVIKAEEKSFIKTLERGISIFEADVREISEKKLSQLPGDKAFRLYDTYGFPLDLTQLMAQEKKLTVDVKGFEELMEQQRKRAQAAQKNAIYQADALSYQLPATDDTQKYHSHTLNARLLGYVHEDQYIDEGAVPKNTNVGLIFDRTCAYAEAGGQVGDNGTIAYGSSTFVFEDTIKAGAAVVHFGSTESDQITIGSEMTINIDPARLDTQRNHTATHLLQWALQKVLGDHAHQEGSLVCADYLRFDFTHSQALSAEQIEQVEKLVHQKIAEAAPVTFTVMPIDQARELGAMALFSEKYGEHVRVLAIGSETPDQLEEAFSREFCGGTHVNNTSEIGGFKITREESVATGVRRITALTGRALNEMLHLRNKQMDQLGQILKASPEQIINRVAALLDENKKLKKQLQKGTAADLKTTVEQLLEKAPSVGSARIIVGSLPTAPVDAIRTQIDWLRKKAPSSVTVLACATEENKVLLFAAVTDDLIKGKTLKAGDVVKAIAPIVGGGGGGRPQMAQAGGKNPEKIDDALAAAKDFINKKLS